MYSGFGLVEGVSNGKHLYDFREIDDKNYGDAFLFVFKRFNDDMNHFIKLNGEFYQVCEMHGWVTD